MRNPNQHERRDDAAGRPEIRLLVTRAQAGDVAAFACLATEHQVPLARFCRRLLGDRAAAEDLAQETLFRAQCSIGHLGEPYRFGPWLFGIAANLAKKWWRVHTRSPLSLESLIDAYPNIPWDESLYAVASPEQLGEEAEQVQILVDAIGSLPESLNRVVVLHYLDGFNYAEVAAALDVPASTVKGRLFKSRMRLRETLLASGFKPSDQSAYAGDSEPSQHKRLDRGQRIADRPDTQKGNSTVVDATTDRPAIRIEVDIDALVNEAYTYVTSPGPANVRRQSLKALGSRGNLWIPRDILDQMVLDGVTKRDDVVSFVTFCLPDDVVRC